MGNQARVAAKSTVVSTSTRNFPNRLGDGAFVYLSSAELASVAAILGRIPTVEEYMEYAADLETMADDVYRYLNFNEIESYTKAAQTVIPIVAAWSDDDLRKTFRTPCPAKQGVFCLTQSNFM